MPPNLAEKFTWFVTLGEVIPACVCGDREPRRDGQAEIRHLREVCAFAT
jgi:hypothetical protein